MDFREFVANAAARALGVGLQELDLRCAVGSAGFDSYAIVALVAQIEAVYETELPVDELLDVSRRGNLQDFFVELERLVGQANPSKNSEVSRSAANSEHTVTYVRPRCSQLFLLYRGMRMQLMMAPTDFASRTGIHDRNLLLFGDVNRKNYLHGISPEISTFGAFLEWQKSQIGREFSHVQTTYCVGTSGGSMAAILSGHMLKSAIVWSFSLPFVQLSDSESHYLDGTTLSGRPGSLGEFLASGNGVTEFRLYYNESQTSDREAAESLASCPGVKLYPQKGSGHVVLNVLRQNGEFEKLLVPFQ